MVVIGSPWPNVYRSCFSHRIFRSPYSANVVSSVDIFMTISLFPSCIITVAHANPHVSHTLFSCQVAHDDYMFHFNPCHPLVTGGTTVLPSTGVCASNGTAACQTGPNGLEVSAVMRMHSFRVWVRLRSYMLFFSGCRSICVCRIVHSFVTAPFRYNCHHFACSE